MDFHTFTEQYFDGDFEKAYRHLVNESYYKRYSLSGSKENLQAILDTMTRPEAKVFMKYFRQAIRKDREPFQESFAPVLDIMRGTDTSWQRDEEFIRKGNPFGKEVKKDLLISFFGILVALVITIFLRRRELTADDMQIWMGVCLLFGAYMSARICASVGNYRRFKKAEERLKKKDEQKEQE